jgi:hypothetical protein
MTVEVKVTARRVLFPNSVVDRQTGKDQVNLKDFGCIVVSFVVYTK